MNPSSELLLAASTPPISGAPQLGLTDALLILVFAGFVVVVYQLNQLLRRLAALEERLQAPPPAPARVAVAAAAPQAAAESDSLPPELLAAIVAAVHASVDRPARIVSISDESDTKRVWSLEGRRQIFASHQVR